MAQKMKQVWAKKVDVKTPKGLRKALKDQKSPTKSKKSQSSTYLMS